MKREYDVVVVGGGIAGLTAAWELHLSGAQVIVLEADETPGGHVRTLRVDGFRLECGPHSFMGSSEGVFRLVRLLELEPWLEPAGSSSGNRYIVRNNKPLPLPAGFIGFLTTPLLSIPGKIRMAMEPFIPRGGEPCESAWDFFTRRFGTEAAKYMMSPFISGIYAGDIHELGARAAFPKFVQFEQDSGSMILGAARYMKRKRARLKHAGIPIRRGLFSFLGGLGRITETLSHRLKERLATGHAVTGLRLRNGMWTVLSGGKTFRGEAVILAVPPDCAAPILGETAPGAAGILRQIPMAPLAVVHWSAAFRKDMPSGFGMLVPRHTGYRLLGTLFPDEIFIGRRPGKDVRLFVSFYGGRTDPEASSLPAKSLIDIVRREHERIFKLSLEDDFRVLEIMRYPSAIPQLLPDHPERICKIKEEIQQTPGLFLAGNYLTGIGMEHSVNSGFTASERCLAWLRDTPMQHDHNRKKKDETSCATV